MTRSLKRLKRLPISSSMRILYHLPWLCFLHEHATETLHTILISRKDKIFIFLAKGNNRTANIYQWVLTLNSRRAPPVVHCQPYPWSSVKAKKKEKEKEIHLICLTRGEFRNIRRSFHPHINTTFNTLWSISTLDSCFPD